MVNTRSQNRGAKRVKYNKQVKMSEPSDTDESDLDYIDDDISKYESQSSQDSDGNSHSNNIKIKKPLLNKIKKRKRKASNESDSESESEESDEIDSEESSAGDSTDSESLKQHLKKNLYEGFINSIVENMADENQEDTENKQVGIKNNIWKKNLTKKEIAKYDTEYSLIQKTINALPSVKDILTNNMPFDVKCEIMEKLIILDNLQDGTVDHLHMKKKIISEIEKYKKFNLGKKSYANYSDMEEKLNEDTQIDLPLKYKILNSKISFKNKLVVYNKYKYYNTLTDNSNEESKLLNWMETVLKLPTETLALEVSLNTKTNRISKYLSDVNYILESEIYGMKNVKEQILCTLNNKITNPKLTGNSIGLVGPQGVGKTQIIKVLSKAIKLPFSSISLGGMSDAGHLLGYNFTYEGSRCGAIVDSLLNMKYQNGILFFDEIDKISTTKNGDEISKALLHITDFTQNNEFCDKYLGNDIKIDLSNLWFIYSLNYKELIDKTLLDRLSLIEVSGYTSKEKKEMVIKYLIPNALDNIGISGITFSDESLKYIIKKTNEMYTAETKDKQGNSGVRKLKDCIRDIISKLNFLKNIVQTDGTYGKLNPSFAIKDFKLPYVIKKEDIETLNIFAEDTTIDTYNMYM